MRSLEELIKQAQTGGKPVDTGEFTLNTLAAREKLSQYQMGDTGLWLVKMLQAAVCCQAPEFRVFQGDRLVKVVFQLQSELTATELLRLVHSGALPSDPFLFHLVTEIRGTSTATEKRLSWSLGGQMVEMTDEGFALRGIAVSPFFELESRRPARGFSFKRLLKGSLKAVLRQTLEENKAIRGHCWTSPIPIFIDGREMDRGYDLLAEHYDPTLTTNLEQSTISGPRACLVSQPLVVPTDLPEIPYPIEGEPNHENLVGRPFFRHSCFIKAPVPQQPCRGVLCLFQSPGAESSVEWVLDGAVVKSHPLPLLTTKKIDRTAVRLVVGATIEHLDLSQFNLRDDRSEELVRSLQPELLEMERLMVEFRSSFIYIHFTRGQAIGVGVFEAGLVGMMSMASLPVGAALTAGLGVFGHAMFSMVRAQTYKRVRKFVEHASEVYPEVS